MKFTDYLFCWFFDFTSGRVAVMCGFEVGGMHKIGCDWFQIFWAVDKEFFLRFIGLGL
ncbi:hypothetical protein [Microbulbifer sp. DLAB2-AA]|uniref:hypothetical protein n=1 Tax=Microbulbifer sp. DLAB2-AA TaxID=3243394 RepID=UPI00403A6F0E